MDKKRFANFAKRFQNKMNYFTDFKLDFAIRWSTKKVPAIPPQR